MPTTLYTRRLLPAGLLVLALSTLSGCESIGYYAHVSSGQLSLLSKRKPVDEVIASLEQRFPGVAAQVEMRDVATPMTWERYTGNWRGSFQGWRETTKTLRMRMSKTLPGLESFYMAGQWVEPGGSIPTAVMSGRNVTQMICKRDKKGFATTTP